MSTGIETSTVEIIRNNNDILDYTDIIKKYNPPIVKKVINDFIPTNIEQNITTNFEQNVN